MCNMWLHYVTNAERKLLHDKWLFGAKRVVFFVYFFSRFLLFAAAVSTQIWLIVNTIHEKLWKIAIYYLCVCVSIVPKWEINSFLAIFSWPTDIATHSHLLFTFVFTSSLALVPIFVFSMRHSIFHSIQFV